MAKQREEVEEQPELIETEHPAKARIIAAAKKVKLADKDRSAAQEDATAAREKLAEVMKEAKLTQFVGGGFTINITVGEKVSVKSQSNDE